MKSVKESFLDRVMIAAPCSVSWDSMQGDDRVRFCGLCSRNVYNISEMSRNEAEKLLSDGSKKCLRLYRRADGTVMTNNCPVGLRKLQKCYRRAAKIAATVLAFCFNLSPSAQAADRHLAGKPTLTNATRVPMGLPPVELPASITGGVPVAPAQMLGRMPRTSIDNAVNSAEFVAGDVYEDSLFANNKNGYDAKLFGDMTGEATWVRPDQIASGVREYGAGSGRNARGPAGDSGKGLIKLNAQMNVDFANMHADKGALDYLDRARRSAAHEDFLLAQAQYQSALNAFDEQANGDSRFRELIQNELAELQERYHLRSGTVVTAPNHTDRQPRGAAAFSMRIRDH